MSNQSGILAAIQAITGTARGWNGDWHALFDMDGIPDGSWNGRMLAWINGRLGTTYTSLPAAQMAFAIDQGFSCWNAMNDMILGAVIQLSANTIAEDSALNAVIGTLSVANGTGTWTFTELADPDGKFNVSGSNLRGGGNFNYEAATSHTVTIQATNGTDTIQRTFTIFVTDIFEDATAPTITSSASVSVFENSQLNHALTADESVTWSIVGGADQARFELSGSTLRWASNGTKDFEAPDDANTDNAYVVQVRATDAASNFTNQTITVTVQNLDEGGGTTTYVNFLYVGEF